MMPTITQAIVIALGISNPFINTQDVKPTIEWVCEEATWDKQLTYNGSLLSGQISANCAVKGEGQKGLAGLRDYYLAEIPNQAAIVHEGPVSKAYKGMSSTYFDVTVNQSFVTEDTVSVRSDVFLATDEVNVLHSDTFSKKVTGSGNAAYLKKIDFSTETVPLVLPNVENRYKVKLTAFFTVQKPAIVFPGYFRTQVKKGIENNIDTAEKNLLETMGAQL